jgi:hypothetical protein
MEPEAGFKPHSATFHNFQHSPNTFSPKQWELHRLCLLQVIHRENIILIFVVLEIWVHHRGDYENYTAEVRGFWQLHYITFHKTVVIHVMYIDLKCGGPGCRENWRFVYEKAIWHRTVFRQASGCSQPKERFSRYIRILMGILCFCTSSRLPQPLLAL